MPAAAPVQCKRTEWGEARMKNHEQASHNWQRGYSKRFWHINEAEVGLRCY